MEYLVYLGLMKEYLELYQLPEPLLEKQQSCYQGYLGPYQLEPMLLPALYQVYQGVYK